MKKTKPLVSICCATYNHEPYIETALKGFLKQKCDFEYEILIHDDASTDKTAEIIRKYEKLYPDKIFPIYQTQNQYSQGKKYSDLNYERARGKYIAICEGDDCWIDKNKLAIQIEAMQKHKKCGMCFHNAKSINCLTSKEQTIGQYAKTDKIIKIQNIISKKHGMVPTASLLLTKKTLEKVLNYKKDKPFLTVGDLYFQIFGSLDNGAIYIHKTMSIYRHFTENSWSIKQLKSKKKQILHIVAMARTYQDLNQKTDFKYNNEFELSTLSRVFSQPSFKNIKDIPATFDLYKKVFLECLKELKKSKQNYTLYGAGVGARLILEILYKKIDIILDKDDEKNNSTYLNKRIVSLKHLKNQNSQNSQKIIISLIGRGRQVLKSLVEEYGFDKKRFIVLDDIFVEKKVLKKTIFKE